MPSAAVAYLLVYGVPIGAAVGGLAVAASRPSHNGRLAGVVLALLGGAEAVAIRLWFRNGCFETWQPCSGALGVGLWLVWLALAAALLIVVGSVAVHWFRRQHTDLQA